MTTFPDPEDGGVVAVGIWGEGTTGIAVAVGTRVGVYDEVGADVAVVINVDVCVGTGVRDGSSVGDGSVEIAITVSGCGSSSVSPGNNPIENNRQHASNITTLTPRQFLID